MQVVYRHILKESTRAVGFRVEAKKTHFRYESLKMKALFSDRSGWRPVRALNHIPRERVYNISKE